MTTTEFNASVQKEINRLIALGKEKYEKEEREAYEKEQTQAQPDPVARIPDRAV